VNWKASLMGNFSSNGNRPASSARDSRESNGGSASRISWADLANNLPDSISSRLDTRRANLGATSSSHEASSRTPTHTVQASRPITTQRTPSMKAALKVKNLVNVLPDSIRIFEFEECKSKFGIEFSYDSLCEGNVYVFLFVKETGSGLFESRFQGKYSNTAQNVQDSILRLALCGKFSKGSGLKFRTSVNSSGCIDLNKHMLKDLVSCDDGYSPVVITLHSDESALNVKDEEDGATATIGYAKSQSSFVILEKTEVKDSKMQLKARVLRQTITYNGKVYIYKKLFGNVSNGVSKSDPNSDDDDNCCVICLEGQKTAIILPCLHVCLCENCANGLRRQENSSCPLCRSSIKEIWINQTKTTT